MLRNVKSNILKGKKAAYYTLGCKLNFAETSTLGLLLKELGVETAAKGVPADICIINTCTVTEVADSKDRQMIHKVVKAHPGAFIAVTGCYAQLKPQVIGDIEGVDLVVGAERKSELIEKICEKLEGKDDREGDSTPKAAGFFPACSRGDRTRYFLKVQDGCNYFCTYCTVPLARGRSRNGSIASIVEQAQRVADEGGKEIVITGVNTGDFGRSTGENFFDLIKALDKVEGIERYRISSIEPNLLTDDIIDFCASSRAFMPHFHIPLQCGSDEVLKLMHRRYTTDFFRQKIEKIKKVMPDCFIGVDTIVGMRGETDEYFEQAYKFIEGLDISQLHVFSYSERPNTKALEIPYKVSPQVKHERSQRLIALSEQKLHDFYARFIGTERLALMEHTSSKAKPMNGFTDNYIRIEMENHPHLDNQIVKVRMTGFNEKGDALRVNS